MAPSRQSSAERLLLLATLLGGMLLPLHAHDLTIRCYLYGPRDPADRDGGGSGGDGGGDGRQRTNTCYYDRYEDDVVDGDVRYDDHEPQPLPMPPTSLPVTASHVRQETVFILNSVQLIVRTFESKTKKGGKKFDRSNYIYDIIKNITIIV